MSAERPRPSIPASSAGLTPCGGSEILAAPVVQTEWSSRGAAMRCARCQQENPPRARFCIECAAPLARSCAACGAELPATARFCPQCAAPAAAPGELGAAAAAGELGAAPAMPRHLAERILESRAALEGERKQVT